MRLTVRVVSCLLIFAAVSLGQERMVKNVAGLTADGNRSAVTFMSMSGDSYTMKTLFIDTERVKNKTDEPTSFYIDLTSTVRNIKNGDKVQRILVMKWTTSSPVQVKCENSRWAPQATGPELDTIIAAAKEVVKASPRDRPEMVEFSLPGPLEKKIENILDSLQKSKLTCVRGQ